MSTNLEMARQLASNKAGDFYEFFEDKNDEVRERLFMEFNSLSVVYQKPSERFLKETELKQSIAAEKKYFPDRKRKIKLRGEMVAGEEGEAEAEEGTEQTQSLLDTGA